MQPLAVKNVDDIKNGNIDSCAVIWSALLDEIYWIEVHRSDYYNGVLHIFEILNDNFIHVYTKDVTLSYGAMFGPDVMDVLEWEKIGVEYADL